MKSTIKSKINRFLKYLGITVSRPKRPRARKPAYRSHVPIEDANTGRTHHYGDSCPGGHYNDDLTDTCERPRVEQPKSNLDITGPTS